MLLSRFLDSNTTFSTGCFFFIHYCIFEEHGKKEELFVCIFEKITNCVYSHDFFSNKFFKKFKDTPKQGPS